MSHSYFHLYMLSKCFITNDFGSGSLHNGPTGNMHIFRIDYYGQKTFVYLPKTRSNPITESKLRIYMMVIDSDSNYKILKLRLCLTLKILVL